jgi:alpha-tubulin suppressor-like RCC1 family protein
MRGNLFRSSVVAMIFAALLPIAASFTLAPVSAATSGDSGSLAGGDNFSCAVADSGAVLCWGSNAEGQLGDGTQQDRLVPTPVNGLGVTVVEVSAGWQNACALTVAGGVKCWGLNRAGQLGNGTTTSPQLTPTDVTGLTSGVQALSAGLFHTCALTDAGGVKCWGDNSNGELGDGTLVNRSSPVDVVGLTSGVVAIAAGGAITCAVSDTGALKCWGDNATGGIGDGTTVDRMVPTDVVGLSTGVAAVSAESTFPFGSRTCAVTDTGAAKCWGTNNQGQLGDGTLVDRTTPTDVVGLSTGVTSVTTGSSQTCAVTTSGGAKCWGQWAVGSGLDGIQPTPVDVVGLTSGVAELQAGGFHTCALDTAGGVSCWGGNAAGQLGIGAAGGLETVPRDVSGSFHRPECPTLIANARTDFSMTNGYAVGSVATFVADPGYALVGSSALTCQSDLSFDGVAPAATSTSSISVAPSAGLVGGQTIEILLSGFTPNARVGWCQAVDDLPVGAANCTAPVGSGTTDGNGALTTEVTIRRFIHVPGRDRWADCAEPTETCLFGAADLADLAGSVTSVALDIITPPPPTTRGELTMTPARVDGPGTVVNVSGRGFRAATPIEIYQCVAAVTDPSGCSRPAAATATDGTGGFSVDITVTDSVDPPGGTQSGCFDPDGRCVVVAAETADFPGTAVSVPVEVTVAPSVVLPGGAIFLEQNLGTATMALPVTLDRPSSETVEVPWRTIFESSWDETLRADPDVDYVATSGTVVFAPGDTTATVSVEILGDLDPETVELLVVSFTKPANAELGGFYGLGFGAILDNDSASPPPTP